jgi:hypothetical protein
LHIITAYHISYSHLTFYVCLLTRLAHISLHYKVRYQLHSTKMEAATFLISDKAHYKYQFLDPEAYYVHHMSRFEHSVHRSKGLDTAKELTLILSTNAFNNECSDLSDVGDPSYFVIIPFYGKYCRLYYMTLIRLFIVFTCLC